MRNIATKNKIKQMKRNINLLLLSLLFLVGCVAKAQDKNQTVMANNKKVLVAYFSYSGTTKGYAEKIARYTGADIFEIQAAQPYTEDDVDWTKDDSRVNQEMKVHPDSRPGIKSKVENLAQYDVVFLGFPIWWYIEPNIINTFLETQDFRGKRIVPFFTSYSSGPGKTDKHLHASIAYEVEWFNAVRANSMNDKQLKQWVENAVK